MEIRTLNSIRALAALLVVLSHYSNAAGLWGGLLGEGGGQYGVMLFFILSGFLMAHLYLEREFSAKNARVYLVNRLGRVAPLYLVVVLGSYLVRSMGWDDHLWFPIQNANSLMSHLFLFDGKSILWTIPVEIQYYVLFVGLWFVAQKSRQAFVVGSLFTIAAIRYAQSPTWKGNLGGIPFNFRLIEALPLFLSGSLLGWFYRYFRTLPIKTSAWFALVLPLVFLMYPRLYLVDVELTSGLWKDFRVLFSMLTLFALVAFLVPPNSRVLANPVGDYVGKISYSIYLLHLPLLRWMEPVLAEHPLAMALPFLLALVLVASLSYYAIESRARRFFRSRVGAA